MFFKVLRVKSPGAFKRCSYNLFVIEQSSQQNKEQETMASCFVFGFEKEQRKDLSESMPSKEGKVW